MSVSYILGRVGNKMGMNPSDSASRKVLLGFLNEAADELYTQADLPGSLMEWVLKVNGDQTVSMPAIMGKIRGVREAASMQVWHVNRMRPRYNQFNWTDMWRNFRLLNDRALQQTVTNQSVGVLTVSEVESPPVVVTVSGPTPFASRVNEVITMDAVSKQTTNNFLDYDSAKKDRVNQFDITLSDIDGKVLTVIPNNHMESLYQIYDVSSCPWLSQNTSVLDNYLEILYKKRLPWLSEDGDEFPAVGFDNVLVNKILQLWAEEQEKTEVAAAYDAKASRTTVRKVEDENRDTEDMVSLVAHPHDTLQKRTGSGIRRRYSLYAGRKY